MNQLLLNDYPVHVCLLHLVEEGEDAFNYYNDREVYASVSHAYMSSKSNDPKWIWFCSAAAGNSVKTVLEQSNLIKVTNNWEVRRFSILEYCLRIKFSFKLFKDALISVPRAEINTNDHELDMLLIKIRDEIETNSFEKADVEKYLRLLKSND